MRSFSTFGTLIIAIALVSGASSLAIANDTSAVQQSTVQYSSNTATTDSKESDEVQPNRVTDFEFIPEEETSRHEPAPPETPVVVEFDFFGDTFVAAVWVLDSIRGEDAWQIVQAANPFNEPPPEGREYLLVLVAFFLEEAPEPDIAYDLGPLDFDLVSATGREYDHPIMVSGLDPDIRTTLYEGASHAGLIPFIVDQGDEPVLTFGRDWRGRGGAWLELP